VSHNGETTLNRGGDAVEPMDAALPFTIDCEVMTPIWTDNLPDLEGIAHTAVRAGLSVLNTPKLGELSLAFTRDDHMQTLNRKFRGQDKPTNVLAFPAAGPAPLLGDIAVSFETVAREAGAKAVSLKDHTVHLLIHGFLHLQGYDHLETQAAQRMEALEIRALRTLGIDNPYEIKEL